MLLAETQSRKKEVVGDVAIFVLNNSLRVRFEAVSCESRGRVRGSICLNLLSVFWV